MSRQDDLKRLIYNHRRRLQILKEQKAARGLNTPPEIITEIEDIETELADLRTQLARLQTDASPATSPSPGNAPPAAKKPRRNKWAIGCTAIFLLAAVVIGIMILATLEYSPGPVVPLEPGQVEPAPNEGFEDEDGDGLPAIKENLIGTDPGNPDTDRDGVPDGEELELHLDPLNPDTDEDSLPDGHELEQGSDPRNPDSP